MKDNEPEGENEPMRLTVNSPYFSLCIVGLFFVGLLLASPAYADINELNTLARQAIVNGQPQKAKELLIQAYQQGEYDNQTLFLLAISEKQLNNLSESEKYLSELLARDPDAGRVKLELAEVLYRNGKPDKAKTLLLEVKAANPPPKVGENIDAFLAFIEKGEPDWSSYASLGLMYDTNVNQGPTIDNVLMYGLPFTLNQDAKANSDWATVLKAGTNYTRSLNQKWALQAGFSLNYTDYRGINSYDALSGSISAGPSWGGQKWFFSIPYIFYVVKIGHAQEYYSFSHGVAPQVGYHVSPQILLQASLSWQKKHYKNNSIRDGDSLTFSPSVRYAVDSTSYVGLGGYVGDENSGIETSGNYSKGLNLSCYKAFSKRWSLYASPAWSKTNYHGIEAAYGKNRQDKRWDATVNLNYLIEPWNANLTLSHTYSVNDSSIDIYRYTRRQTMLSISKNF